MSDTVFIQYKGTSTCLDLHCPSCEAGGHYCVDMPFSGKLRCHGCKTVWVMSSSIELREATPDDFTEYAVDPQVELG